MREILPESSTAHKITTLLLTIYIMVLIWILIFKLGVSFSYMEKRNVNLIPFSDVFLGRSNIDIPEILLNILIFVPLGIYVGILYKKGNFRNKLFLFFLMSLVFESLQYIFRIGAFDATDIVTNTTGAVVGLLLFKVIERLFNDSLKAQKFINIAATIATLLMLSLLFLLKMNMLPIRYQ